MQTSDLQILRKSKIYASETRWLSWWHLISTMLVAAAITAASAALPSWWIRVPLAVILGLVAVRLFIVYHDFLHGAVLRGSRTAKLLMHAIGLLLLSPPSIWSRSHNHHHRNVGKTYGVSIGSYPLMTPASYAAAPRKARWAYAASRHPLTIAFGYLTIFLYGMCVRSLVVNPRLHKDSAVALVLHTGILAGLWAIDPTLMLGLVVLPMLVAGGVGAYLFYAQHNFPGVEHLSREEWTYCRAALSSSSFICMGPIARWFTGNIGFHHVHHVNACIPFYRLPEAMRGIPELQLPRTTTLRPKDIARCLRLKLWSPDENRMTGWVAPDAPGA